MSNYSFLRRNERGLYTSNGSKMLFIDKRQKDELQEGLVKYSIYYEKPNYGFIVGDMVKVRTFKEALKDGVVNLLFVDHLYVWNSIEIFECSNDYLVYTEDGLIRFNPSESVESNRQWQFIDKLINFDAKLLDSELSTLKTEYILSTKVSIDENRLIELIINNLAVARFGFKEGYKILVHNNLVKFVNGEYFMSCMYYNCETDSLITFSDDLVRINRNDFIDYTDKIKKIILDLHLCCKEYDHKGIINKELE